MEIELLSIAEVSMKLKCHTRTARRLISRRVVPGGVKIGGRWKVRREVLEGWLIEQSRPEIAQDYPLEIAKDLKHA